MTQLGHYRLVHKSARQLASEFCLSAPDGTVVRFSEPTRSLDQNSLLWATLTDISKQVQWHVDGRTQLMPPEDWKSVLSAGLTKTQRVAAGTEGGFVMLGSRTSKMTVKEMASLIEFAQFFGDSHGVKWSAAE